MPTRSAVRPPRESDTALNRRTAALAALFALALAAALALAVRFERGDPLWLDEAWTIAVAGQRTWGGFLHQVYWDVNAPLYLLLMHLWQAAFGLSDLSLRLPSLLAAAAAPLVLAFVRIEGLPTADRLAWAALTALWFPLISYAEEARCYALLMLLSTAQAAAFLRLLHTPTTARAMAWTTLAALSILTHYDAVLAGGVQGLVYLAVHRWKAVRTWPAALAFLPAFGWMAYHLPRASQFARPEIAWYSTLRWSDARTVAGFLAGRPETLWALALVAAAAVSLRFAWPRRSRPVGPEPYVWLAVLAAAVSAAVLIVLGALRPSFAQRYLTPDAPGVLLGVVLAARWLAGGRVGVVFAELVAAVLAISAWRVADGDRMAPHRYNYETASRVLEASRPARLVFLWDHPVAPILHPEQLQAAGGAFFRRDGRDIPVDTVVLKPGEDPNLRLMAEARTPGSAILWVYDVDVHGTAAARHPPAIAAVDPAFACGQFGRGRFGVYACVRRSPAPA